MFKKEDQKKRVQRVKIKCFHGLIDYLKNQHRKGAKKIAVYLKIASEKA